MITSRQKRSAIAARVALGLVVAGTLVGAAPSYAAPALPCTSHFPVSNYALYPPGVSEPGIPEPQAAEGQLPRQLHEQPSTPVQQPNSQFDWLAAGVGAAGMLGLILLFAAGRAATRIARNRRHGIPFVVDVRDDTPATG